MTTPRSTRERTQTAETRAPDDMQASRCPSCGQQMRGTDWTDRMLADRDLLLSENARLRAALQTLTDAVDGYHVTEGDIRQARALLANGGDK